MNVRVCIKYLFSFLSVGFFLSHPAAQANGSDPIRGCNASLKDGVLILENRCMSYTYDWNEGQITGKTLTDKTTNYRWEFTGNIPDCFIPGLGKPLRADFSTQEISATTVMPAHLRAEVVTAFGKISVKRVFRIYADCPAIACDLFVRGKADTSWKTSVEVLANLSNIENKAAMAEGKAQTTVLTRLGLPGNHWRVSAVQFFDITDRTNNLVEEYEQTLYRGESRLSGNILFADELLSGHGIFIVKESPSSRAQLAYPGFDFSCKIGEIQVTGIGVSANELSPEKWVRCYGFVTGVTSGGMIGKLNALRTYQEHVRLHQPERDEMILMNTWGDRNQDKSIREMFILDELKAAHSLGITHYQIDDGWQTGRSANSAFTGGSFTGIWDNPNYWTPDPQKFPNGFKLIMELAKKLGIEICLWFNPSKDSSYAHWQQDAGALIRLYKEYGIRTFKIDGVQMPDKVAEENLRKIFDTLMVVTHNEAVFNLDVTAGKRCGYHYFNEYGNIFLENRYTDWGNYYPHWTLRNLWMLSKYVPAQNLQIEFLNNYRNADKYPEGDKLAPSRMSFEYLFAITMMAQPLAWMEATGLPPKAFDYGTVIKKYGTLQHALHSGKIFPVGNEPDGLAWTGFQSIKDSGGYLLIIRESNSAPEAILPTWLPPGKKVVFTPVLGYGKPFNAIAGEDGKIKFSLPSPNSYVLYKYSLHGG